MATILAYEQLIRQLQTRQLQTWYYHALDQHDDDDQFDYVHDNDVHDVVLPG